MNCDSAVAVAVNGVHQHFPLGVKELDLKTFHAVFYFTESENIVFVLNVHLRESRKGSKTSFSKFLNNRFERIRTLSNFIVVRDVCRLKDPLHHRIHLGFGLELAVYSQEILLQHDLLKLGSYTVFSLFDLLDLLVYLLVIKEKLFELFLEVLHHLRAAFFVNNISGFSWHSVGSRL